MHVSNIVNLSVIRNKDENGPGWTESSDTSPKCSFVVFIDRHTRCKSTGFVYKKMSLTRVPQLIFCQWTSRPSTFAPKPGWQVNEFTYHRIHSQVLRACDSQLRFSLDWWMPSGKGEPSSVPFCMTVNPWQPSISHLKLRLQGSLLAIVFDESPKMKSWSNSLIVYTCQLW